MAGSAQQYLLGLYEADTARAHRFRYALLAFDAATILFIIVTMELLSKQPEHTTLVSVGHRPELEAFHSRKIVLERRRGGARNW